MDAQMEMRIHKTSDQRGEQGVVCGVRDGCCSLLRFDAGPNLRSTSDVFRRC